MRASFRREFLREKGWGRCRPALWRADQPLRAPVPKAPAPRALLRDSSDRHTAPQRGSSRRNSALRPISITLSGNDIQSFRRKTGSRAPQWFVYGKIQREKERLHIVNPVPELMFCRQFPGMVRRSAGGGSPVNHEPEKQTGVCRRPAGLLFFTPGGALF